MDKGKLFVISAPSGAGKSTILRRIMADVAGVAFSISHTTRKPRPGERDGVEYNFVSREQFLAMIDDGQFIEYAEVHGNLYGTSGAAIEQQLRQGLDVILDIDVQGAEILRNLGQPEATFIFIAPPGLGELESRLRGRGTESEEVIRVRLKNAQAEMRAAAGYDYLIINDVLDEAEKVLTGIILAERAKAHRFPSGKAISDSIFQ
ncbi:MAG: guanylate kinase [Desulforhopalus sp.]